jgi:hypothetical protein
MNAGDERINEIESGSGTDSTVDKVRTERLPPGRRFDMQPRRPRTLLLFTIAMTLLLAGALLAIRSNRSHLDSGSAAQPIAQSTPARAKDTAPAEPIATALKHRVDELSTQLARYAEETDKKIDRNADTVRSLEDKLATFPTVERVAAIEDSLAQSRDALTKDVARLEQSLARLRKPAIVAKPKPIEPTLPFQAVSLDLWDGVPYVGLLFDGRIEPLRVGQARGGWTVEHIDYRAGRVRFRNDTGQTVERTPRK